jgi:(p)ppGpp synthase/HD superfamily hydrolase
MTEAVVKAMLIAREQHTGQTRSSTSTKWAAVPYFMHLIDVVSYLSQAGAWEEFGDAAYITGFLHDTLEDTQYTTAQLSEDFGSVITKYVSYLTLPPEALRDPLKTEHQIKVMMDCPELVRAVKIADKTSNTYDMVRYAPNWSTQDIHRYIKTAGQVVSAGMSNSEGSRTVAVLADIFWEKHSEAARHYGVTP